MKTLKERMDIFLELGTEHPEKWMPVHGYQEVTWPIHDAFGWAFEWRKLRDHHLAETKFLFEALEELRERLKKAEEK
jgi:hypothetical protein